jgi:hypothetical protein
VARAKSSGLRAGAFLFARQSKQKDRSKAVSLALPQLYGHEARAKDSPPLPRQRTEFSWEDFFEAQARFSCVILHLQEHLLQISHPWRRGSNCLPCAGRPETDVKDTDLEAAITDLRWRGPTEALNSVPDHRNADSIGGRGESAGKAAVIVNGR